MLRATTAGFVPQHGDRYASLTQSPAFVFGEGLSYTRVLDCWPTARSWP
ncbi:hypothetical protein ACFWN7_05680 [Agromyces sp. NPDC058484]